MGKFENMKDKIKSPKAARIEGGLVSSEPEPVRLALHPRCERVTGGFLQYPPHVDGNNMAETIKQYIDV